MIPHGVHLHDDCVARHVELHMTVHRPCDGVTGCGEPLAVMQPPIGAYLADGLAARWCEKPGCFPRVNEWDLIVDSAHPPKLRPAVDAQPRDRFPVLNSSRRWSFAALLHLNRRQA